MEIATPADIVVTGAPASGVRRAAALMLLAGLSSASLACAPALASQLSREFGFDAARVGFFFSAEFAGFVISGLAGQWLMPRFPWRRIAFFSLVGFLAGTILTAFVLHSLTALLFVRALTASCGAMIGVVCMASANEEVNSSRAFGFYIIGQLAVGVAGLAVLPMLFERFGFISYLVVVAVLLMLAARMTAWLASGKRMPELASTGAAGRHASDFRRLLRFPVLLLFYIALGGIWTFVGDLAGRAALDPVLAGKILSAATVAGIVGAGVASLAKPDADTRIPVIVGYFLLVASALTFLDTGQVVAFVLAVVAFKFAWTYVLPFILAIIGELDEDGRIIAEIYLVAGLGLMLGPSIAGQLVSSSAGYPGMLLAETAMVVVSGISIWVLRRMIAGSRVSASPESSKVPA